MFKHSGRKLKKFAVVLSVLFIVLSLVAGLGTIFVSDRLFRRVGIFNQMGWTIIGAGVALVGLVLSLLCGLMLYGYGEVIEKVKESEYMLTRIAAHSKEIVEYLSKESQETPPPPEHKPTRFQTKPAEPVAAKPAKPAKSADSAPQEQA